MSLIRARVEFQEQNTRDLRKKVNNNERRLQFLEAEAKESVESIKLISEQLKSSKTDGYQKQCLDHLDKEVEKLIFGLVH